VLGLMRSAAVHGAERGIRVNGVAPGVVLTDLVAGSPEGAADATRRAHITPQRRPGTTDEVADLIAFLLSDNAGFMTGEMVSIDGGATAMNPVRHSGQPVGAIQAIDASVVTARRDTTSSPASISMCVMRSPSVITS